MKIELSQYKKYSNSLDYWLKPSEYTKNSYGRGTYFNSDGYYIHIYAKINEDGTEAYTELNLVFAGTVYVKKYIGKVFTDRGLCLICAQFIKDFDKDEISSVNFGDL